MKCYSLNPYQWQYSKRWRLAGTHPVKANDSDPTERYSRASVAPPSGVVSAPAFLTVPPTTFTAAFSRKKQNKQNKNHT